VTWYLGQLYSDQHILIARDNSGVPDYSENPQRPLLSPLKCKTFHVTFLCANGIYISCNVTLCCMMEPFCKQIFNVNFMYRRDRTDLDPN
jgi:hypothetical protein